MTPFIWLPPFSNSAVYFASPESGIGGLTVLCYNQWFTITCSMPFCTISGMFLLNETLSLFLQCVYSGNFGTVTVTLCRAHYHLIVKLVVSPCHTREHDPNTEKNPWFVALRVERSLTSLSWMSSLNLSHYHLGNFSIFYDPCLSPLCVSLITLLLQCVFRQ